MSANTITELKRDDLQAVAGGVVNSMTATYSATATYSPSATLSATMYKPPVYTRPTYTASTLNAPTLSLSSGLI